VQCTVCLADSQFGARALAQISKCAEYLSDDARTTGGGVYDLRSVSGCGTIVPLRMAYGFRWG
jgi:hypothetical protein